MDIDDESAGWWAGGSEESFAVGPHGTKDAAIEEALAQDCYSEVEIEPGVWKRRVFFAECGGLHYECDECGTVPKACGECVAYLYPDESASTFQWSRNHRFSDHDYEGNK